ncbi:hypothetical protein HY839_02665 [Candidatus Azambacteria bacterium]|nr:hypothetical protein [Candidatus Azambacteria bacterium]
MSNQPLVGQNAKKKLSQFLSATLAFTTTVSLSGFALMFAFTASAQVATLSDGDVVKTADNPDVYIVKMHPHGQYAGWKRLILNPEVFNLYGHLKWSNIKTVNQATVDAYHTSALVRGENDPKVYVLAPNGDVGTKTWITNEAEFLAAGYDWSQIAQVNNKERDMYTTAGSQQQVPAATGTGLMVSLASNTAAAGSIVSELTGSGTGLTADGAQAQVSMLTANFAAGSDGDVAVTTLKVKRMGISADADIANAYLYDGATRVAEMTNISSTYISFVNASGLFTVSRGTSKAITVKMDVANGTSAGKTMAFAINVASDVVAGTATVSGSFPIVGNGMTTANVGDLGKITIADVSSSTTVDPGQTGYEVWKFSVAAADQKVSVSHIKLTNVGSVATTDLTNIKLMDGATQLGATAATLAVDGTVTFDLSSNPLVITAGQTKNLSVKADIVGGTTRTFRFSVQRSADIVAMDTNYGVYLKPNQTDSFLVIQPAAATTINSGTLTISIDPASPTGNVAAGYTDQELARFAFKASGEAVKVSSLTATSTTTGTGGLNNAKLYLDGTQVGATADIATTPNTTFTFGNSFIIPAGATKTLVIKAEVKTAAGVAYNAGETIQAKLVAGSLNAQGQTSMTSISTSAANGNTLTVQTGLLTTSANTGLANATTALPTGVKGSTNVKIASFVITAGSGEGADVSQIVVKNGATEVALGRDFQNLTLKSGSSQIGTTVGTLSTTAANTYTFNPSPAISINAGQQYVVDVYADVLSSASNAYAVGTGVVHTPVILDSVTATSKSTNSDASDATDRNGQSVFIALAGSLTVAAASDMPIAQNRAMGQTGQTLATFKLTTGTPEAVNISSITVTDLLSATATAATGSVTNLSLWNSAGVQVGSTVASMSSSAVGLNVLATFNGLTLNVAKDKSEVLTLKGDMNTYPNAVSGSAHMFKVQGNGDVTAVGATSGQTIAMTGAAISGNNQRVYRAELTVASAMSNFSGGASTDQNIGKYRFTNTSPGNYSITVSDIDLGLSTSKAAAAFTATRYVTLKRDSVSGATVAKTQLRPGVLYTASALHFSDITSWTVTAGNVGEQIFTPFTIDASNGTGYVDIYVLADTTDTGASTITISNSLGSGNNVVTWGDGVSASTSVTSVDGMPAIGATVTY